MATFHSYVCLPEGKLLWLIQVNAGSAATNSQPSSLTQMALWTSCEFIEFMIILGLNWLTHTHTHTDTHWHHLTPGSCALCVASSSFVFPCSPQMRCNFQTAQLGTSFADFAGYCPVTGNLHPDLYWDVYQDRDIGVCFVCIFFAIGPAPLRSFSQLLFLWARPHQRPHLLSLLQSQPVNG